MPDFVSLADAAGHSQRASLRRGPGPPRNRGVDRVQGILTARLPARVLTGHRGHVLRRPGGPPCRAFPGRRALSCTLQVFVVPHADSGRRTVLFSKIRSIFRVTAPQRTSPRPCPALPCPVTGPFPDVERIFGRLLLEVRAP